MLRDREEATPEAEFDYALPPHLYKFKCKQAAEWSHADEVGITRKAIQSTSYWAAEVRALCTALIGQVCASENAAPPAYWQEVLGSLHRLAGDIGLSPARLHEIRQQIRMNNTGGVRPKFSSGTGLRRSTRHFLGNPRLCLRQPQRHGDNRPKQHRSHNQRWSILSELRGHAPKRLTQGGVYPGRNSKVSRQSWEHG